MEISEILSTLKQSQTHKMSSRRAVESENFCWILRKLLSFPSAFTRWLSMTKVFRFGEQRVIKQRRQSRAKRFTIKIILPKHFAADRGGKRRRIKVGKKFKFVVCNDENNFGYSIFTRENIVRYVNEESSERWVRVNGSEIRIKERKETQTKHPAT